MDLLKGLLNAQAAPLKLPSIGSKLYGLFLAGSSTG